VEATASSLTSVLTHLLSCSLLCDRPPELPFSAHSASSSLGGRPNAPPPNVSNASAAALQVENKAARLTAKARRRHFHGSTSLARSNFELTVPFLVDTRTGKPMRRSNRRKLADQLFRRLWPRVSLELLTLLHRLLTVQEVARTGRIQLLRPGVSSRVLRSPPKKRFPVLYNGRRVPSIGQAQMVQGREGATLLVAFVLAWP
jgi:hypothetical protein